MTKKLVSSLILASGALFAGAASASLVLNTGVAADGSVLSAGSIDPLWTISTDGVQFSAARVAYPGSYPDMAGGQTCCGMETVAGVAAWITTPSVVATSPTTGWGVNNMVYARRSFDLSGYDLSTVTLNGRLRVADSSHGIYINGSLVPGTGYAGYTFTTDHFFSLAAGSGLFQSGANLIEMRGDSVNDVWDAFWLDAQVIGRASSVPEPTTLVLLLAGLALCGVRSAGRCGE